LQRELDADAVALGLGIEDLGRQRLAVAVEVLDELLEAAAGLERLSLLLPLALIGECDRHAFVEVGELTQPRGQRLEVVEQLGEDLVVGLEPYLRARLLRGNLAKDLQLGRGVTAREIHVVLSAIALHPDFEGLGERVHDRHTNAVEPT
jgi:hypothetical protein